jgi:hypothetical protein
MHNRVLIEHQKSNSQLLCSIAVILHIINFVFIFNILDKTL